MHAPYNVDKISQKFVGKRACHSSRHDKLEQTIRPEVLNRAPHDTKRLPEMSSVLNTKCTFKYQGEYSELPKTFFGLPAGKWHQKFNGPLEGAAKIEG